MVSRGVCICPASNKISKYTVSINLLSKEISYGIDSLVVYVHSQLVVSQLNNIYQVRDPCLYHHFLKARVLQ